MSFSMDPLLILKKLVALIQFVNFKLILIEYRLHNVYHSSNLSFRGKGFVHRNCDAEQVKESVETERGRIGIEGE